jgi:DMSO/TMAO reductase YedYZ molybdopterin-dependent catalytic subunit
VPAGRAEALLLEERQLDPRVELLDVNAPGFWETNGYHLHADPWSEERYSDQETDAMQRIRAEASRRVRRHAEQT